MTSKWNSRKFAALLITLIANFLIWARVEADLAEAFATAAINALTLGYVVVQGWIDAKGAGSNGK